MDPNASEGCGNRWSIGFLLEAVDGMYMELVFSRLSQAVCLILPAVFTAITSLLLASVQLKPILRRAVGCLPEPLCEHLEIFLPVLVTKMLSPSLVCPWFPCSTSRGRGRGSTSVLLCQWHPCMWSVSERAPQQRQRVADVQP